MPQIQKKNSSSSEDEQSDSCTLADVLITADAVVSQDTPVNGPPITLEVVDSFTDYLVKNKYIKKILLLGLNAGRIERVIAKIIICRLYGRGIFKSKRRHYGSCP